jgi:hypothetical protein
LSSRRCFNCRGMCTCPSSPGSRKPISIVTIWSSKKKTSNDAKGNRLG